MSSETPATGRYLQTWTSAPAAWFTRPDGSRLRYVDIGDGDPIVLLHTVRTQLDYFQRLIPLLSSTHRILAVDFPGMGWSDIVPGAEYRHDQLRQAVVEFIRGLDLRNVTVVGESMGSVIALTASIELGDRVRQVVASNTYDYFPGLERANLLARVIIPSVRAPLVGPLFAAAENRAIVKGVMSGGFADPSRFPDSFIDELVRVGRRPGYSHVARAIYRNLGSLVAAQNLYPKVSVPVRLLYATQDWSHDRDRQTTAAALSTASVHVIDGAGHFCAMERPEEFAAAILDR